MEFLRRSLFILLLVSSGFADGQINTKMREAFTKSYLEEQLVQYDKAIQHILEVYSAKSYECNLRLGWLYYLTNKYSVSMTYYNKASKLMPKSTEPLWAMVNPLSSSEKWGELNKVYLRIIKLDPKNSLANYRIGLYYYYNKKYSTAKKYFEIVVNLYPTDFDALHMCGWANYFLGNMDRAKSFFIRALLIQPTNQSAQNGLGLIK